VRAIAAWREREAERRNVPRNRVIRDDLLLEMAAKPPHSADELGDVRGLSRRLGDSAEGRDLIAAIVEAEQLPEAAMPMVEAEDPRLIGGPTPLGELLRVLLKIKGHEHGVAPKLIASSSDLDQIAVLDEPDVPALKGWRYDLFGKDALALKEGRLGFAVKDNRLLLLHLDEQGAVAEALIRATPHSSGPRPSRGRRGGGRRPRRQSPDAAPAP
jgi:ribonuclease D